MTGMATNKQMKPPAIPTYQYNLKSHKCLVKFNPALASAHLHRVWAHSASLASCVAFRATKPKRCAMKFVCEGVCSLPSCAKTAYSGM
eukprot:6348059-Amphidinium_carterae.1